MHFQNQNPSHRKAYRDVFCFRQLGWRPPCHQRTAFAESTRFAAAYGTSALDLSIEKRFNEIFEREVAVFFVATGTAANSLSLASIARPGGLTFCHSEAHVIEDECGAPDFFSGMRMVAVEGPDGKMLPENLIERIARYPQDAVHHGRAAAITMTQATEAGTVYTLDEIDAIAKIAKENGLPLHMDGARFANALAALGTTPAEMTWKRGVDVLSFGGTKNGCWCAEAIVFFDPALAKDFAFLRKRTAQLFRNRASSPRNSKLICRTICGWVSQAMPMPWPTGCAPVSPRSTAPVWHGRPRRTRFSPFCRKPPPRPPRKRVPSSTTGWCRATCLKRSERTKY